MFTSDTHTVQTSPHNSTWDLPAHTVNCVLCGIQCRKKLRQCPGLRRACPAALLTLHGHQRYLISVLSSPYQPHCTTTHYFTCCTCSYRSEVGIEAMGQKSHESKSSGPLFEHIPYTKTSIYSVVDVCVCVQWGPSAFTWHSHSWPTCFHANATLLVLAY